ncbi:MAG: glycosyltransferase [Gemmatimonadaceae bacterium]|nr:glycosyltransferase [Gemmatimonadaceae bacterium]NUS48238.1 glycosyltransferase [Gemmatimonadaceae bacterium]
MAGVRPRVTVAFVIDNMRLGGTELNAVRTAERLDRSRFDLRMFCLNANGPLADRYRALGVPVTELPIRSLYGPSMVSTGLRFVRELRRQGVQVVHAHDMYSNIFASLWGRVARVPVVITSRRWWHTCPNRKLRAGNRVAFRLSDAVLANSAAVARSVHEEAGIAPADVWTVSNFADDSAFEPLAPAERALLRRGWRVPQDALVVGCVARLDPLKDHATLLRAIASLRTTGRRVHLVLIGDGELRRPLEQLAADLDIGDAVTFVGEVRDGRNHHRGFDVSALCSLSEGFPNTLVEAMAGGRPVVATAVGGSVDAVVDGETGLLVPPSAADDLAAALARLLDDPEARSRMGRAGYERARRLYGAQQTVAGLEGMYDALLARSAR